MGRKKWYLEDDVICSKCGNWFCPGIAEHTFNDWWKSQYHPELRYRDRYPNRDVCENCAIPETEEEVYNS